MSSIILEEENYVELPERYIVQGGIGKYKKVGVYVRSLWTKNDPIRTIPPASAGRHPRGIGESVSTLLPSGRASRTR